MKRKSKTSTSFQYYLIEMRSVKAKHIALVKRFLRSKAPQLHLDIITRATEDDDNVSLAIGQLRTLNTHLLGSYCFLKARANSDVTEALQTVRQSLKRYLTFVTFNNTFAKLDKQAVKSIERLRKFADRTPTRAAVPLAVGDQVKVLRGMFTGFNGFVTELKSAYNKDMCGVHVGTRYVTIPRKFLQKL